MTEAKAKYYWQIQTETDLIWIYADRCAIGNDGVAVFYKNDDVIFALREWKYIGAASVFNGDLVYIEHWDKITDTQKLRSPKK